MFDILIKSNTLNFLIVLTLVIFLFYKLKVVNKIEHIVKEIKDYIDEARKEKDLADKEYLVSKDALERLPQDIEQIKSDTKNSVENISKKTLAEIEEHKKDIENNAKRLLNLETKKFQSKLISVLSEKSVEIAKENAINQLKENAMLHNKYIDEAISELDRINL